jgi:hypothetical protein
VATWHRAKVIMCNLCHKRPSGHYATITLWGKQLSEGAFLCDSCYWELYRRGQATEWTPTLS